MTTAKVRAYVCNVCHEPKITKPGQRGPVPQTCPDHKTAGGRLIDDQGVLLASAPAPPKPPPRVVADPFNSTPFTAPRPAPVVVQPSAVHDPGPAGPAGPAGPGPIERQLVADLEHIETTNPLAKTLAQVALRCARAADLAPADDLKSVLGAVKELRALMAEITKSHIGGGDDDGFDDTPVGASRPEIRHTASF